MSEVPTKEKRIATKKAELKEKHSDWDDKKLEKTAGMMVGGEIKREEAKVIKEAHEKTISDAIKKADPDISDKDLAKKTKQAIAKEERDAKIKVVDEEISANYKLLFDSIVKRAKLDDAKQSDLPKDLVDAINKIKNLQV